MSLDQRNLLALFSYGTLQDEPVQRKIFDRVLDGAVDVLLGFKLGKIEIGQSIYLIAVKSENQLSEVQGKVFFISATELAAADGYEGTDYHRVETILKSGQKAWVYVS